MKMKPVNYLSILLLCFIAIPPVLAQETTTINVNSLNAPESPVFNLMGVDLTSIERPKDPTDFFMSVKNATNNFTTFPNSYSLEFAPRWLFGGKPVGAASFLHKDTSKSKNFLADVAQSAVISMGFRINDSIHSSKYSQSGVGFKLSLCRGTVNSDKLETAMKKLKDNLVLFAADEASLLNIAREQDAVYKANEAKLSKALLQINELDEQIESEADNARKEELEARKKLLQSQTVEYRKVMDSRDQENFQNINEILKEQNAAIKKEIQSLDFRRAGFMCDLAGGFVIGYEDKKFTKQKLDNAGLWLTAGYGVPNDKAAFDILFLARYLYSRHEFIYKTDVDSLKILPGNHFLDFGPKVSFTTIKGKLTISGEAIVRVSTQKTNTPIFRYTGNINYQILPNKTISLAIGKDFIKSLGSKDNLLIAFNLLVGFGNARDLHGLSDVTFKN